MNRSTFPSNAQTTTRRRLGSAGVAAALALSACGGSGAAGTDDAFLGTDTPDTPAGSDRPPGPRITDHWHHAYGFYLCDEWVELVGDGEKRDVNGQPTNVEYARTGVHSHDDGLIHWHPFTSKAIGENAQFGVFLDVYGVELSDEALAFPDGQLGGATFEEGTTDCAGQDAELSMTIWRAMATPDEPTTVTSDFRELAMHTDAMVVAVVFAPPGTEIGQPPSVDDFATNVASDSGGLSSDQLFPNSSEQSVESGDGRTLGIDESGRLVQYDADGNPIPFDLDVDQSMFDADGNSLFDDTDDFDPATAFDDLGQDISEP